MEEKYSNDVIKYVINLPLPPTTSLLLLTLKKNLLIFNFNNRLKK